MPVLSFKVPEDSIILTWLAQAEENGYSRNTALRLALEEYITGGGKPPPPAPPTQPPAGGMSEELMRQLLLVLDKLYRKLDAVGTIPTYLNEHPVKAPPDDRPLPRAKRPVRRNGAEPVAVEPEQEEADDEAALDTITDLLISQFG